MEVLIGLIVGAVVGTLYTRTYLFKNIPLIGTLRLDTSIPEDGRRIFLEINQGALPSFYNSKEVRLKVSDVNYISSK